MVEVIAMNDKAQKKAVSIVLPIEVYDRLQACAEYDTRTLSAEIRQILKGYLEYLDRGGVSWCDKSDNRGAERYE